ncbi:MAG: hypoxanthine phosphoribosyltransferase [Clostridia bacterium]|nr:hypoxanthine phosphoribosyltransferase [Clostridia bacterium]
MKEHMTQILLDEEQIDALVTRIAHEIDEDHQNEEGRLLLLCILKGSVVFMGDLMKKIKAPVEIDFMKVSSYGASTVSSGELKITLDLLREDLDQLNIVIVEDIIDSGNTLSKLVTYLKGRGAASVKSCALLDKPSRRKVDYHADYVGVEIPDEFVVGYGLDYNERYRALPYIGILKEEIYK